MGHDNVNKAAINHAALTTEVTAENATPAALASSLPVGALYAKAFEPLYASVNPAQLYPYSPEPSPYARPSAYADFAQSPNTLVSTLQTATTGNSIEDKLLAISDDLQAQMDTAVSKVQPGADIGAITKLQSELNKIMQMMNMITNLLKKLDDTKSNIVGNIS